MENKSVGIIIGAFVALLIGIIAVGIIAENTINKTALLTKTDTIQIPKNAADIFNINESKNITLTSVGIGTWKDDFSECTPATIIVRNESGAVQTLNTGYKYNEAGGYMSFLNIGGLNNSGTGSNATTVLYTYCGDEYLSESWVRTVFNMIPGFFALALLVTAAFIIFWIIKQEGIQFDI